MDADLLLVVGVTLGVLVIPSLLSAFTESRAPRAGAILVLISATLIAVALTKKPEGYRISEIPNVYARVIERYLK